MDKMKTQVPQRNGAYEYAIEYTWNRNIKVEVAMLLK